MRTMSGTVLWLIGCLLISFTVHADGIYEWTGVLVAVLFLWILLDLRDEVRA